MPGIFITYRREDSRADSGRLAKELKNHFGKDQVFRDIDAIEPGMDFVKAITSAVGSCGVLLVIIGPNWLSSKDENGRCRLENRDDYVRLEIEAALDRDIRVIPLLVGGAAMPRESDLPESLSPLVRRQAYELSEGRWDFDVERLAAKLEAVPGVMKRTRFAEILQKTSPHLQKHRPDHTGLVSKSPATAQAMIERTIGYFLVIILFALGILSIGAGIDSGTLLAIISGVFILGLGFGLGYELRKKFRSKRSGAGRDS